MPTNTPKRHHYLPQSYLRQFSKDDLIWVFDRQLQTFKHQLVGDTTVKRHFYSTTLKDGSRDTYLETILSGIETPFPSLCEKLRKAITLSPAESADLCLFTAFMMFRGPDFHDGIQKIEGKLIHQATVAMFSSEELAAKAIAAYNTAHPESSFDTDPKDLVKLVESDGFKVKIHRNRSLAMMCSIAPEIAHILATLNLSILHAGKNTSFLAVDRPTLLVPTARTSPIPRWGGLGILTPGVHKYLPIASDLLLAFEDIGSTVKHVSIDQKTVMYLNSCIARMTDRFLLSRDLPLLKSWVKRLQLQDTEKVETYSIS